jgi:hypothetical protein
MEFFFYKNKLNYILIGKMVNQWDDNPIAEEPRNLSTSPDSDNELKTEENQNHQDEAPSWNRKYCEENIYRPPKSRSTSYIKNHWKSNSSDDGSQSHDYSSSHSSGSKTVTFFSNIIIL